jgi:aminocarboxymuconate-semialdehyde decarboxylase
MITSPKWCAQYPTRFAGLATIPLQDPGSRGGELERCVRELGLRGAQIGTHVDANEHCHRTRLPQSRRRVARRRLGRSEQLDAAIFVHPWDMLGKSRMPKFWLPWLVGMPAETCLAISCMTFGGVFERFPKLRVAYAHGGGSYPFTIGRWSTVSMCVLTWCRPTTR